jgi:hypothetical protein
MANDTFYFPSAFLVDNGMADLIPPEERSPYIVLRSGEVRDLAHRVGGRSALPPKPIMIVGPRGTQPLFIAANGNVEGAELEEIAIAEFERQEALARKGKGPIDFDRIREKRGLWPREHFDTMLREAMQERIRKHKRNIRTDPPRQMNYKLRHWQQVPEGVPR